MLHPRSQAHGCAHVCLPAAQPNMVPQNTAFSKWLKFIICQRICEDQMHVLNMFFRKCGHALM